MEVISSGLIFPKDDNFQSCQLLLQVCLHASNRRYWMLVIGLQNCSAQWNKDAENTAASSGDEE